MDKVYECYTSLAVKTKNISLCEKIIGGQKTMCVVELAQEYKDISLCEKVTDSEIKATCYTYTVVE